MSITTKRSDTHEEKYACIEVDGHLSSHATIFLREEASGVWMFNIAYCSKKDQLDRQFGRKIARRRYFWARNTRDVPGNWVAPATKPMSYAIELARRLAP